MAIEQFGESLLSSQRARQEKLASQQRKQERKEVLIGLGVKGAMSLANTALKDKAESFLQNEKVLAARSQYKAGINTASTILDEQKKIAESGQSAYQYFEEQIRPLYKEKAMEYAPPEVSGDERLFEQFLSTNLKPLVEQRVEQHNAGVQLAGRMEDISTFDADLLKQVKSARPVNIVDYASRAALNFFKGKSSVETEADVLSAIENSKFGKNAEAMLAFNERYAETKNAVSAFNYASLVLPEAIGKEKPDEKVTTEKTIAEINGVSHEITKRTTTNSITGEVTTAPLDIKPIGDLRTMTADKEREIVKGLNSVFNVIKDANAQFTPQAYSLYLKAADDALGTGKSLGSDLTLEEHKKVMDVYTKFATDNNNLKDQFKNDVYIAGVEQLSGLGVVALQASLAIQENPDSPEATEAVERLTAAMSAYYSVGQQIANIAVESRNTPRRNIHGVSNYDELTPAAQLRLDSMTADEFNKAYGQ
jgi:uncharacterized protein YoaH (UPF0181 family)